MSQLTALHLNHLRLVQLNDLDRAWIGRRTLSVRKASGADAMDLNISFHQGSVPVTIFRPRGNINLGTVGELEQQARQAIEKGTRYMLIDLTEVNSLTSAGLRAIQVIHKLLDSVSTGEKAAAVEGATTHGGRKSQYLKLLNPGPHISRVLHIAGFADFIEIFTDQDEALASF